MKRQIFVTNQFIALHSWPKAPEAVAFLRSPHRHMFHVSLAVSVQHNERDVEFFTLKSKLAEVIHTLYLDRDLLNNQSSVVPDIGSRSCETIAEEIIAAIVHGTNYTVTYCSVSEDLENGAILSFE